MAARVILGKSVNSNLGHGSGEYGLFISRTGDDITNCTKDQLVFNTDTIGNNSGAIDLGQFQVLPTSGTNASVSVSVNAGATASVGFTNQTSTGHLLYGKFAGGVQDEANITQLYRLGYSGASSGDLVNLGNAAITMNISIFKGFSVAGLF
jgi:hypothetical protein